MEKGRIGGEQKGGMEGMRDDRSEKGEKAEE